MLPNPVAVPILDKLFLQLDEEMNPIILNKEENACLGQVQAREKKFRTGAMISSVLFLQSAPGRWQGW